MVGKAPGCLSRNIQQSNHINVSTKHSNYGLGLGTIDYPFKLHHNFDTLTYTLKPTTTRGEHVWICVSLCEKLAGLFPFQQLFKDVCVSRVPFFSDVFPFSMKTGSYNPFCKVSRTYGHTLNISIPIHLF